MLARHGDGVRLRIVCQPEPAELAVSAALPAERHLINGYLDLRVFLRGHREIDTGNAVIIAAIR